ncbi:hypothetical protein MMC10_010769 [Thelotrema lepadinum]|nr:hypothetical protein [Thelotrema lepadinum]
MGASGRLPPPPQASTSLAYTGVAAAGATGAIAFAASQSHSSTPSPSHMGSPPSSAALSTAPAHRAQHHNYIPSNTGPHTAYSALQQPDPSGSLDSPTSQIIGRSCLTSPTVPLQHLQLHYPDYLSREQGRRSSQSSRRSSHHTSPLPPPGYYAEFNYAHAKHAQAAYGGRVLPVLGNGGPRPAQPSVQADGKGSGVGGREARERRRER